MTWFCIWARAAGYVAFERAPSEPFNTFLYASGWLIFALVGETLLTSECGNTIGKRMAGIVVVDKQGNRPNPCRSFHRAFFKCLYVGIFVGLPLLASAIVSETVTESGFVAMLFFLLMFLVNGFGFPYILFGRNRKDLRGFPDRLSRTQVVVNQ